MDKSIRRRLRFTLLELLIATMAGAVLMAALVAALSGAWRLQEQADEQDRSEAPRQALRQRLALELALAVPPSEILSGAFSAVTTEVGDSRHDDVQWVTAIGARNPESADGDLVQVHYYLTEADDGEECQLVRTEARDLLAVETEEPEEVVLLDRVISFAADWYDGESWVSGWDSTVQENQLPEAARVRIEFAADSQGATPRPLELVVPLVVRTLSAAEGTP